MVGAENWQAARSRHYFHMLQLNSYRNERYAAWLSKNAPRLWFFAGLPAAVATAVALTMGLPGMLAAAFGYALAAVYTLCAKKPEKKPFVVTDRVKRQFLAAAGLLLAALLLTALVWRAAPYWGAGLLLLFVTLPVPVGLPPAANRLMAGRERRIADSFVRSAQQKLQSQRDFIVIGVTGSYGKTSVKYILSELLREKYNTLMTPESYNTTMGVVRTVNEQLRPQHQVFVCEMGARQVGDIKEICDIVHPKHGIITSVGPMHIESFKTIENVQKTKFELADAIPSDGMLFLNFDCDIIRDANHPHPAVHYGIDDHSGYYVSGLKISEKGSEFRVTAPSGESCDYKTPLIGRHNVLNICGAIAVANSLRISLEELRPAVRRLESVPHRLQLINRGDYTVIDDAYNSNPSGAKAALETLSMAEGMKILVTPGMIELGGMEYELNREFGEEAAAVCDYVALVGEKQTKPIADGLLSAGYPENKLFVAQSLDEAMKKVYSIESGGRRKIILLENDLPDNY